MALFQQWTFRLKISPDRMVFVRHGGKEWVFPAQVWWDDRAQKVVGIGAGPFPGAVSVPLFRNSTTSGSPEDKTPLLERYFLETLGEVISEQFLRVKPEITVEDAETLAPTLGGYQRGILRTALLAGGAMKVVFA